MTLSTPAQKTLESDVLRNIDAYWRAANYLSVGQIYLCDNPLLKEPLAFDPILSAGQPLLRRPKHSATLLTSYLGTRWETNLSGSFVGRRADSDFFGYGFEHTPGYVLVNAGAWYIFFRFIRIRPEN